MPIVRYNPLADQTRLPQAIQRLAAVERNILLYGDPLAPEEDRPDGPSILRVWKAQAGTAIIQSIVSAVTRRVTAEGYDPDFNPFEYIRSSPRLRNDPLVQMMVERGQFDHSYSVEQFDFDLAEGRRFLEDIDALRRSSWTQYLATLAGAMIGDPANLIPGGVVLKTAATARRVGTAAHVARTAALVGAWSLAGEKTQNFLQPISNEPGLSNEAAALAAGALFGAGLGAITSPSVRSGTRQFITSRKFARMRRDFQRMMDHPVVRRATRVERPAEPPEARRSTAIPYTPPAPATERLTTATLQQEIAEGTGLLRVALDEEPVDNTVISALHRPGDENDQLIQQLRWKYQEAGRALHVVDHPDQWYYDMVSEVEQIMNHPGMSLDAAPEDFDHGWLDAAVTAVTSRYASAQAAVTPGGRLAQTTLGRLHDVYRTLSGSAQTVTRGSASDPFSFESGAPAENIARLYEAQKDLAILNLRTIYRQARRSGEPITYNGEQIGGLFGYGKFRNAVTDYLRRQHARRRGFDVAMPEDVHPAVKQAADATRRYLAKMRDEMEIAGQLGIGPRTLERAQRDLEQLEQNVTLAREQLEQARATRQRDLFDQAPLYTIGDIRARLEAEMQTMPSALDEANTILENLSVSGDTNVNLPEVFSVTPDDVEHLSPAQRARLAQRVPITEDASDVREAVGDRLYEQAIAEALGGTKARFGQFVDGLLSDPDSFDPERVLDAWLFRRWEDLDPDQRRVARVVVNPADLPEGAVVRVFDDEWTVYLDDGQLMIGNDDLAFGVEEITRLPVDRESLEGLDVPTFDASRVAASNRVRRLEARLRRLESRLNRRRDAVDKLRHAVEDQAFYFPRVYDVQKVLADEDGFKRRLADSFRRSDQRVDGRQVSEDERPLLREVAEKLDRDQLEQLAAQRRAAEAADEDEPPDFLAGTGIEPDPIPAEGGGPATPTQFRVPFRESAKPRFGTTKLIFESDFDRVAYIVRHSAGRRSKRDADYLRALMAFTGLDEPQVRRLGDRVAADIQKRTAGGSPDQLVVPAGAAGYRPDPDAPPRLISAGEDQPFMTIDELVDGLTEGDLPGMLREAYRAELDAYYERNAQAVFDRLTAPRERHGVVEGMRQDPIKTRVMDIDESDMNEFMVQDVELALERYNRVVGGRTAVRRAIQLNPIWRNARLRDGSPIEDGRDLIRYLTETTQTLKRWASFRDRQEGVAGTRGAMLPSVLRLEKRIQRDIQLPLDLIEGRNPMTEPTGAFAGLAWMGRMAIRLSYLNKLGSVFWAQLNDFAPVTLFMLQRPQTLAMLPRAILKLKSLPRRDLEVLGLMYDQVARTRAIADVDYLTTGMGFGDGLTRQISARMEEAAQNLGDVHAIVALMNWITNINKRVAGGLVLDRVTDQSKRLLRAEQLVRRGMERGAAFRRVGLDASGYDAARLNKIGLNASRARLYHQMVYRHGLTLDDTPIRQAMSFDDYMASKAVVKPNFQDWPLQDPRVKDLFDVLAANINGEVNRSLAVTPGAFDRPLINFTILGRIFNQFQTFGMAFVNQRLRVMAQMPAKYQLWYIMNYWFLGAISDAISNHLSGRRTLDETARLWADNPLGMSYAAWERSGLAGWLGRPLAIADALQIPFSPGVMLDNTVGSTPNRHVQPGKILTYLGPVAADLDRAANAAGDLLSLDADQRTAYNIWKLMPFQNLLWLRMVNQTTGLPVVPESLMREKFEQQEAKP